jgi:anti-sigma B factor antagonist
MDDEDLLQITVGDAGVIHVSGDIDMASGPLLENVILDREHTGPIELDLSGVGFIDSSGLRTLLMASRRATERGRRVVLHQVGPEVGRLLEITGTTEQFDVASQRG